MKSKRFVTACCLLLFSGNAHAEAGWTDYAPVLELTPTIHERFHVRLAVSRNPSGCRDKETFYQVYSFRGAERIFDVLMKALIHENKVRVFVTGQCDINGYSEISSASIVP